MAARVTRPPLRLLGHHVRIARPRRRGAVASSGRPNGLFPVAIVCGWAVPHERWPGQTHLRRLAAFSGAARPRLSTGAEYRKDRGTLAHAHQDSRGSDTGAPLTQRLARD